MQKPIIKILVGYHKPAVLIKDDVYVPIQLGRTIERETAFDGALSEEDIAWLHENMIGDDTGDNISALNRKCSELSGMYWAWKNYDTLGNPDYIGCIHYRRHFVFKDREQEVLGADIVLPEYEKLPYTLYEHYKHDHHIEDLDLALEIIKQDFSDYAPYIPLLFKEKHALLCNMFVMKKALFFAYMEWLFAIIAKLDRQTNYQKYSYYNHRMWGFLSERLFSVFIEKVKQDGATCSYIPTRVEKNTAIPCEIKPAFAENNIPIVFSSDDTYAPYLGIAIYSLITNSSIENNYDIFVLDGGISETHKKRIKRMEKPNVSIRFVDIEPYLRNIDTSQFYLNNHFTLPTYFRFFLPTIFSSYKKLIYLDTDIIIEDDIAELFATDIANNLIGAVFDVEMERARYRNTDMESYLQNTLKLSNKNSYFQAGVLICNIEEMNRISFHDQCFNTLTQIQQPRFVDQCILNAVCKDKVTYLPIEWNVEWHLPIVDKKFMQKLPAAVCDFYMHARDHPRIIHYASVYKPWQFPEMEMAERFWYYARQNDYYEEICRKKEITPALPKTKGGKWRKFLANPYVFYEDAKNPMHYAKWLFIPWRKKSAYN